jgi:hypothetical protein
MVSDRPRQYFGTDFHFEIILLHKVIKFGELLVRNMTRAIPTLCSIYPYYWQA